MDTDRPEPEGLEDALRWARRAPEGTLLPAEAVAEILARAQEDRPADPGEEEPAEAPVERPWSWREKLWDTPSETRLGVQELAEALARSKSWIRKAARAGELPARKHGQAFVFVAGEIRHWIRSSEESVSEGPSDPPSGTLRLHG